MECNRKQERARKNFEADAYDVNIKSRTDSRVQVNGNEQPKSDPDQRLYVFTILAFGQALTQSGEVCPRRYRREVPYAHDQSWGVRRLSWIRKHSDDFAYCVELGAQGFDADGVKFASFPRYDIAHCV